MKKKNPLFLKFSTAKNKYVYDTMTNKIFRLDDLTYGILEDFFVLPEKELVEKCAQKHSTEKVQGALRNISRKIEEEGLFFPKRPIKMKMPYDGEELLSFYDGDLEDLILNVTDDCNMRCTYCSFSGSYFYERKHRNEFMDFGTARRLVDFFRLHSKRREKVYYSFYGGEPLLNFPLIRETVEYVKSTESDREFLFSTTTNGTLLSDEMIDFLIKNKFSVTVSLNGPEKVHDRYRVFANGGPTFERVFKNLTKIREKDEEYYNRSVAFNATICPPYDLMGLSEFFQTCDLVKGHVLRTNFVEASDTNFFEQFNQKELDLADDWRGFIKLYIDDVSRGNGVNPFVKSFFERGMMRLQKRPMVSLDGEIHLLGMCTPGVRRLFASPQGKLHVCEKLGYLFPIGDVDSGFDFDRILSLLNRFISICEHDCTQCWAMRLCSACFFHTKKNDQLDEERRKEYCRTEKNHLKSLLISYCSILERNPKALSFLDNAVIE